MNLRKDQISKAARRRAEGARRLHGDHSGDPQLACYLLHISLECAFKLLLLHRWRAADLEGLRRVLPPDDFKRLFETRRGHDLRSLAEYVSLERFLVARDHRRLAPDIWKRITHDDRPYSLRYGTEAVSRKEADEELALVEPLVSLIVEECL